MKTLTIKYHNGNYEVSQNRLIAMRNLTAPQAEQALAQSQEELRKVGGDYTYTLEGDTYRGYKIIARSGKDKWTDGRGKSPKAALMACNACRVVFSA